MSDKTKNYDSKYATETTRRRLIFKNSHDAITIDDELVH